MTVVYKGLYPDLINALTMTTTISENKVFISKLFVMDILSIQNFFNEYVALYRYFSKSFVFQSLYLKQNTLKTFINIIQGV